MTAPDPATWFVGHIGAATIKTNLTDPINSLAGLVATSSHNYSTNTSGQSIPDSTWTTITGWTGVEVANSGTYTLGVRAISVDGIWVIVGGIGYGPMGSPAGQRAIRLYVNSTIVHEFASRPDTTFNTILPFMHSERLAVGDTVHIETYQSQGSSQPLATGPGLNHWSMTYTGPA